MTEFSPNVLLRSLISTREEISLSPWASPFLTLGKLPYAMDFFINYRDVCLRNAAHCWADATIAPLTIVLSAFQRAFLFISVSFYFYLMELRFNVFVRDSFSYPWQENPLDIIFLYFILPVEETFLKWTLDTSTKREKWSDTICARTEHQQVSTVTKSISFFSISRVVCFTSMFCPFLHLHQ